MKLKIHPVADYENTETFETLAQITRRKVQMMIMLVASFKAKATRLFA